jgi:hypothetical protein
MGPQTVGFKIEDEFISVSARDAARLAGKLRDQAGDDSRGAADKIKGATELGQDTRVLLGIGEDACVLYALDELQATGDFLKPLIRLQRALRSKIDREG